MNTALNRLSATQAARAIARGDIRSSALVQSCLDRIAARDAEVNAWAYLDPDHALAQAHARDQQPARGCLHGVPVAIKDIIDTADMPTAYGAAACRGHQPQQDAACVRLLRQAGAVIMGKTVTTEFAYYAPGPTANPHRLTHTPGGSSSGSAAAVADFHVPLALGTQTAGSIIRPASYTGTIGFKPTYATFSTRGIHPLAPAMDTLGAFSRHIEDLMRLTRILTVQANGRAETALTAAQPNAIAFLQTPVWDQAAAYMQQAITQFITTLSARGITVIRPDDGCLADLPELQMALLAAGAHDSLAAIAERYADQLRPQTLALIAVGAETDPALPEHVAIAKQRACDFLQQVFSEAGLIVTAAAMAEAPAGLGATGDPIFNRIWTLLGLPCINLPLCRGPSGLPIGVQLVGPPGADAALLAQAHYCFEVINYPVTPP